MGKLTKETRLRRLWVKHAIKLLGVPNLLIHWISIFSRHNDNCWGRYKKFICLTSSLSMGSSGSSLMLQKKNVSPWFDIKALCDPVSFTVGAPVACSQAFLKWPHAISPVLVNFHRLFPLTVTLSLIPLLSPFGLPTRNPSNFNSNRFCEDLSD